MGVSIRPYFNDSVLDATRAIFRPCISSGSCVALGPSLRNVSTWNTVLAKMKVASWNAATALFSEFRLTAVTVTIGSFGNVMAASFNELDVRVLMR